MGVRGNRPLFSDALGELVDLTETHLTLATNKGRLRLPLTEVHRAKRIPAARRPTAASVVALELAADESWPAPIRDRLGGWLLRSADGWTGRANSALPVGDPDRPLEAAIDAVERWYAAHNQPAMINVPLPLATPVGAALDERGWSARPLTLVQTAPLATILAATSSAPAPTTAGLTDLTSGGEAANSPRLELAAAPSEDWLTMAAARKSGLPTAARHVLTAVDQVRFAHVYGETGLIAAARGTVTGQNRWLGLSLIEVAPEARRQGMAHHMIQALAEWATGLGAASAFLQVVDGNHAAVGLYRRLGFTTHHTYLTRIQP